MISRRPNHISLCNQCIPVRMGLKSLFKTNNDLCLHQEEINQILMYEEERFQCKLGHFLSK